VHFTANDGWVNDPYGVVWTGDRYHMFYQAIPGRVTWAPNCHWGHAESPDLVRWSERTIALAPQGFEVGCWSGSFVVGDDGQGTILYTRVSGDDWGQGKVALARGDASFRHWDTGPGDIVIDGPPSALAAHAFRDPYVFRDNGAWVAVLGAGLGDGSGAALQYRSDDLRSWTYDGVLCSRLSTPEDEVWTGALWECPQLFLLDQDWVLLVSVWDADELHYVAAATGDYDGTKFTPRRWQRLSYGSSAYAMSAFLDRDGRRCVMSWLREEPRNNPALTERAGALSVTSVVVRERDGGRLGLRPHPNVLALAGGPLEAEPGRGSGRRYDIGPGPALLTLSASGANSLTVERGGTGAASVCIDSRTGRLSVERRGFPSLDMPLTGAGVDDEVRLLLDADLVEVFARGSYCAFRVAPAIIDGGTCLLLDGPEPGREDVRNLEALLPGT
jgi:beta-fructofuranosidase